MRVDELVQLRKPRLQCHAVARAVTILYWTLLTVLPNGIEVGNDTEVRDFEEFDELFESMRVRTTDLHDSDVFLGETCNRARSAH